MESQNILLNAAYVSLLVSMLVRDRFQFRVVMTGASLCFIGFAFLIDNTTMQLWNVVFASVNVFHAGRILGAERREHLKLWQRQARQYVRPRWSDDDSMTSVGAACVVATK